MAKKKIYMNKSFVLFYRLSGYFSDTAWYPLPFFDGDVVNRSTIVKFIQRYNVITGNINSTTGHFCLSNRKVKVKDLHVM